MSAARHHAEWLSLVEVSGPFLSLPVLLRVFPQGLQAHDPNLAKQLRLRYEEWEDNRATGGIVAPAHRGWILWVLTDVLGFSSEILAEGQSIPQTLKAHIAEHGETLRPDLAVLEADGSGRPRLLLQLLPSAQDLEKPLARLHWKASPATRMMELLHATGCPLGLATNGERWMLVYAKPGESTGFASWYASLWLEEPITLRAFRSLLWAYRFFSVPETDTLEAMLAESAENQQEVTEQLGAQVRHAVELLVQALDRADQDRGRKLLAGLTEAELYEAALTVMMRLVFLFSAEERGLLPVEDPLYTLHYAVSTLQAQLRETADQLGEEVLERRFDAWCRLLATFRAVHGGIQHDRLELPAYGGRLFDPDRFAFLEGRPSRTRWREAPADPLPVNNRTVLHTLEALQFLEVKAQGAATEKRRLSFRALDIEQIGPVYEGLLDHTATRTAETVLGLAGTREKEPEIPLPEMERQAARGAGEFIEWLRDQTGRSESALRRGLEEPLAPLAEERFRTACGNDETLWRHVKPFAGLVRPDSFGYPVVILPGSVYVTAGTDRRTSGTQYTPRGLTESIVQHALEPLVYAGPAEGKPREQWVLHPARVLLNLKICDVAAGSGAFLVQACRYLSELLVEAWEKTEAAHPGVPAITPEGEPSRGQPGELLIPKDPSERLIYARRLIAQRCLYGVDKNPLAVEMAKLSLWLLTLDKNKPFTFLDHAIKCGDSLLGVAQRWQIEAFDFLPQEAEEKQISFWRRWSKVLFEQALDRRRRLEAIQASTVADTERQEKLLEEAEGATGLVRLTCDLLAGAAIATANGRPPRPGDAFSRKRVELWRRLKEKYAYDEDVGSWRDALEQMKPEAARLLDEGNPSGVPPRRPFHWPIEFPEVFVDRDGFDAILSNPPFMGGQKITGALGTSYRDYLVGYIASGQRGSADLCAYFYLRVFELLRSGATLGMLATKTIAEGAVLRVGLDQLVEKGAAIFRAVPTRKWPGKANVAVAHLWIWRGDWKGECVLDDRPVPRITSQLTVPGAVTGKPYRLAANEGKSFQGSNVLGMGFVLEPAEAERLLANDPRNKDVLYPYLNGEDLNSRPDQSPSRWVINVHDWPLARTAEGRWAEAGEKERKAWLRAGVVPRDYPGPVAADYPDCLRIVEARVKPERDRLWEGDATARDRARRWWQFARPTMALYATIAGLERVLVRTQTSRTQVSCFVPNGWVYGHKLIVFGRGGFDFFAVVDSSLHYHWVISRGSTMRTDAVYTPSDCFETFPFPADTAALESIGERYSTYRQSIMLSRQEGLTATYNRFHNREETSEDIRKLRGLHVEMDYAVAQAYGWADLDLGHGFHETRQGIRYTINEPARREILDRLLRLNHERYAQEVAQGLHEKRPGRKALKKMAAAAGMQDPLPGLD